MARSMTPEATKSLLVPAVTTAEQRPRQTTRQLFEAHAAFVVRLVQRLGVSPSDAEDVAQEVFVIVHRRIGDLQTEAAARSWLFSISRRVVANHLRKSRRRREQPDLEYGVSALSDPAEQLQRARDRARLEAALSRMDSDKRTVFVLFELEGLDMREVAEIVGCPVNTAYSRLYAARELVQRAIMSSKRGVAR